MTGDSAHDRVHQGIDHWARHGVEELTERDAAERAELGEPEQDIDGRVEPGWDGEVERL
jgi:hypothetical protein